MTERILSLRKSIFSFCFLIITISSKAQIITTVAGSGGSGYSGDGGPATAAHMTNPFGVAADNSGNIFIADAFNNVIRKVSSSGIITTFAGTGPTGYSGDGGPANLAMLNRPFYVSVDKAQNVYFTDQLERVIRKVNAAGIITTITGNLPIGYSGDGGPLIFAQFGSIAGMSFDNANNMYITDFGNSVIRKVNTSGIITNFAGTGVPGFSGDGGASTAAQIRTQTQVAIDNNNNNVYIADPIDNRVRVVYPSGIITTFAGTGVAGYSGDGGAASAATMKYPWQVTIDAAGNLYVVDYMNYVIRKIDKAGIISTYAGNGTDGYSGDGGAAIAAQLTDPCGIACDNNGNVYVVNRNSHVVRKIVGCPTAFILTQPVNIAVCNGANASFSVNATGATIFQWQLDTGTGWVDISNNSIYGGTATNSFTIASASISMNGYQYRCKATNACGTAFSSAASLSVTTAITAALTITTATNTICAGTNTVFTATSVNSGSAPIYQWKKNGLNAGTNSVTYVDNTLANGDVISCMLTSNSSCITGSIVSNTIAMIVNAVSTSSVTISPSANNICFNVPVTFTAVAFNAGANPAYQWKRNGINVGGNSSTYTDNTLSNADLILCNLTSSQSCPGLANVNSNAIVMNVAPLVTPDVTISTAGATACPGNTITFIAVATNGGPSPTYQWKKNGINTGANSNSFTSNNFVNGDIITCILTSNSSCLAVSSATSNPFTIQLFQNPVVTLNKTQNLCAGETRILDAGNYNAYLWNDGSTGRTLAVNRLGTYFVTVTDNNGCKGADTSKITIQSPLPNNFLPPDTAVCSYGSITINAKRGYSGYLWSDNTILPSITTSQPGLYWLQVKDANGCIGKDTILIAGKQCITGVYIPTAFTPNNDGKNDYFRLLLFGNIKKFKLMIYNRYGQIVFQSTDATIGWDGNFKGIQQNADVFVWRCNYQLENGPEVVKSGTVTMLR